MILLATTGYLSEAWDFRADPLSLKGMLAKVLRAGRSKVLGSALALILLIAWADWYVGSRASLGLLYILPMMLGAVVLPRSATVALALICAALRSWFDVPSPPVEAVLRSVFGFLTYMVCGLFVAALIRNRELALEHLARIEKEHGLRLLAEDQLKVLVESSPAAIFTIDGAGLVLTGNRAANNLFAMPEGHALKGRAIGDFLPVLADALRVDAAVGDFRTAAQCQGRTENGDIFLAHTWFSSYSAPEGKRLAAIVVDTSEEMRDREQQNLQLLIRGNRIAAAAVSHEVRNLCSAITMVAANLNEKHALARDEDFQALSGLVKGLERIASLQLQSRGQDAVEPVELKHVLDDLRIVIEPDWREAGGSLRWQVPDGMPTVLAERHGLLQAFLNLAQNSLRAVQKCAVRTLTITVADHGRRATIRFEDTGPGIASPERLFEPFQPGADGTGLGLYVSRAVVRSYGGELRFDGQASGSSFTIELESV